MSQPAKSRYTEGVAKIVSDFNEQAQGDQDAKPLHTMPLNEIDVYVEEDRITLIPKRLHGVPVNEQDIIESNAIPQEDLLTFLTSDPALQAILQEDEEPPRPAAKQPLRMVDKLGYGVIVFYLFLIVATLFLQLYLASIQPSASITIVATETPVTTHATISLPAHIFTPLVFTQSQTVPTTGRTHQNATQATGYITFHNSLTQSQTIDAGTLLTGADGVQVVTDETAYVPAGTFSGYGEVTVSAHAVNAGSSGNINAGDINGTCCRVYILVRNNNPFTGGQDERDYQSVAKGDIQHVVSTLSQQFQRTLQEKTTSLVSSTETLLTPIPCTSKMQSDHAAGAEATQVTVTLHETCTPVSYDTQDFQSQAERTLSHIATQKLGTGYSLLGNVETSIEKTMLKNTSLLFTVVSNGMWVYQFNTHQLATLILGKSQQEALALLQKQTGITHISMQVSGTKHDALPAKSEQIHFLVFYVLTS